MYVYLTAILCMHRNESDDEIDQQALIIGETSRIAANLRIIIIEDDANITDDDTVLTFELPAFFINPTITPINVRPINVYYILMLNYL